MVLLRSRTLALMVLRLTAHLILTTCTASIPEEQALQLLRSRATIKSGLPQELLRELEEGTTSGLRTTAAGRDGGNPKAWFTEFWVPYYTPYADDPFTHPDLSAQLVPLSKKVANVVLTNYAGGWDQKVYGAGTPIYWMGNRQGACGWGDLRNTPGQPRSKTRYPYMNGASITPKAMNAMGMNGRVHGVACGACIKFTCADDYYCPSGPGKTSAVAMIVDYCPAGYGCDDFQMDVFRATFLTGSGNSSSNPKVLMERVLCPDPQTNIELRVGILKGFPQYMQVTFADVGAYGVISRVVLSCCPDGMGYTLNNLHYCKGGNRAYRKEMERHFGAWWIPKKDGFSMRQKYCQFMLYQEDGTQLLTRLTRPMKTTWATVNFNAGEYVDRMDTGVQFYQQVRGLNGRAVTTKGQGRRNGAG